MDQKQTDEQANHTDQNTTNEPREQAQEMEQVQEEAAKDREDERGYQ